MSAVYLIPSPYNLIKNYYLQAVSLILCYALFHYIIFSYIRLMKVREAIRMLQEDGWYLSRVKGSHRQFKHPIKPGTVTIAGKLNIDIPPGTLNSILKQSGLK